MAAQAGGGRSERPALPLLEAYAKQRGPDGSPPILKEDILAYKSEGANAEVRGGEDSLLGIAAFHGWDDLVQALLDEGANIEAGSVSDTPLHAAIYGTGGHPKTAALLILRGANVNAKGLTGDTPLHWAAAMGDLSTAQLLIKSGAQLNAVDGQGKTPLAKAKTAEIKALLKKHGAQ